MSELFIPVNLDTEEFLNPMDFGQKGIEQSRLKKNFRGDVFIDSVETLLSPDYPWHKTHLVWAGELMEAKLFRPKDAKQRIIENLDTILEKTPEFKQYVSNRAQREEFAYQSNLAFLAGALFYKIVPNDVYCLGQTTVGRYIVNHTRKEFVDKTTNVTSYVEKGDTILVHPLPLLTACGSGKEIKDIRKTHKKFVGRWAGDRISVEMEKPENYSEIFPNFISAPIYMVG